MKLVNPGLGEIADRLTILALKRQHGTAAGRDTSHFDREWVALHTTIRGRTLNGKWFEHVLELAAVNARLWALTEQMAARSRESDYYTEEALVAWRETAQIGIALYRLNEERARLVAAINELAGEAEGREKL